MCVRVCACGCVRVWACARACVRAACVRGSIGGVLPGTSGAIC